MRLGRLPARIRPARLELAIQGKGVLKVQAMRQSGELIEPVPTTAVPGGGAVTIDFASLANGPTFYYYVQRD